MYRLSVRRGKLSGGSAAMKFNELTKKLRTGDIILTYKRGSVFSNLIWLVSKLGKGDYDLRPRLSHCILYIGGGLISDSAMAGGVTIKNVRAYARYYDLRLARYTGKDLDKKKLVRYCTDSAGIIKYAYFQIVAIAFKKVFLRRDVRKDLEDKAMHCSEYVASAFLNQGIRLVKGKRPFSVSPLDIYTSPKVRIIT